MTIWICSLELPPPNLRFDKAVMKQAIVMMPTPKKDPAPELPPWTGEPTDVDSLVSAYHVEAKIPGRVAGTTLFLVQAKNRQGQSETCWNNVQLNFLCQSHPWISFVLLT